MGVVRDGAAHFGTDQQTAARILAQQRGRRILPALERGAVDVPAVKARIDHGRLIADCPDCGGAEFVWREGPHLLMCQSCFNERIGGQWRRVTLPRNLAAIEAVLAERPDERTRNWRPGESLEALRRENQERL